MTTIEEVPVAQHLDPAGVRHRHLGTAPDDGLIISTDALTSVLIAQAFFEQSGLEAEDVAIPATLMVPVPLHHRRTEVADSRPEAWANPLMWLPHTWRDDLGGWCSDTSALRIGWELIAAGLYRRDTGFVDVLYLYGIDVDSEDGERRVRRWLAGRDDELLDSIEVTSLLLGESADDDWALRLARESVETVTLAGYAATCRSISEMARSSLSATTVVEDARMILMLLASRVRDAPTEGSVVYHVYSELAETITDEPSAIEALHRAISFCDAVAENNDQILISFIAGATDPDGEHPDEDREEDSAAVADGDSSTTPDTSPVVPDFDPDETDRPETTDEEPEEPQ